MIRDLEANNRKFRVCEIRYSTKLKKKIFLEKRKIDRLVIDHIMKIKIDY